MRRVVMSPLIHFFALGGLIFGVFSFVNDDPSPVRKDEITLTLQAAARLADQFAATWRRPPSAAELKSMMMSWVLEEAFVREALTLGLDRGDAVIRQRLNLKMQFLAESGANAVQPDTAMLQSFMEKNPSLFERPAQLAFDQVLLPEGNTQVIASIRTALQNGADPATQGNANMLPTNVPLTPVTAIDRLFGKAFHLPMLELQQSRWEGPFQSGYGAHLVRVTERAAPILPQLREIRDRVEVEWRAEQARQALDLFKESLLERYAVSLPSADDVLAQ